MHARNTSVGGFGGVCVYEGGRRGVAGKDAGAASSVSDPVYDDLSFEVSEPFDGLGGNDAFEVDYEAFGGGVSVGGLEGSAATAVA